MSHDNIGGRNDPHMKSPLPKFILIVVIIALLVIFVAPVVLEIIRDARSDTEERAAQGGQGHGPNLPIRDR